MAPADRSAGFQLTGRRKPRCPSRSPPGPVIFHRCDLPIAHCDHDVGGTLFAGRRFRPAQFSNRPLLRAGNQVCFREHLV